MGQGQKTLRRPKDSLNIPKIPNPNEDNITQINEDNDELSVVKTVDDFVSKHPEGWTFEQETELRKDLSEEGFDTTRNDVAQTIDAALR